MSRLYDRVAARFSAALTAVRPRLCCCLSRECQFCARIDWPVKCRTHFLCRNLDLDDLRRIYKMVCFIDNRSIHKQRAVGL